MSFDERFLIGASVFAYLAAFLFILQHLWSGRPHSRAISITMISAGFFLQTTGLYWRGLQVGACPIGNPFEIAQSITWGAVILFLILGPVFRVKLLGFFTSGFAFTLGTTSLILPGWDYSYERNPFGGNALVELHAALAIFSYAFFALLAIVSLMFLIQHVSLRRKHFSTISRVIPSIAQLDRLSLRILLTGQLVLTLSLLIGFFLWLSGLAIPTLKLLVVVILWLAYGTILTSRYRGKMSPRRLAGTSILLFAFGLLSLGYMDVFRAPSPVDSQPNSVVSPER